MSRGLSAFMEGEEGVPDKRMGGGGEWMPQVKGR